MSTKKTKSITKNYIYNLIYQLFLIIVPLAVTPYVARVLGTDGSGQYSFSFSIVTYFTLIAALGFGYYAQRLVASHQGNKHQQSVDFWEINIARLIPSGLTLIVYISLIFGGVYAERYRDLMLILTINIVAVMFDVSFFFQANEEFGKIVLLNVFVKALGIASIFLFVKNADDLWKYSLVQSATQFLGAMILWVLIPKNIDKISFKELKPLKHLRPTFMLFLPTIATSIYTSLDKTLIGLITQSDAENGNYEYSEKLIKMALTFVTSLGVVLIPRNSKKFADKDYDSVRSNIAVSCKFVFLLGIPLALGCVAVSDNLIPWYLGDEYDKAANLMKILSPIIIIIGLSNVFGIQYLIPSGQDKKFTISIICGAVTNLVLNIPLIYFFKSYGAAIATVIAESTVTFMMYFFIRKDIHFLSILKSSWKCFVSGIVMFICCFFTARAFPASILNTFIIVLIGVVSYGICLLLLRESMMLDSIKRIMSKFKKKKAEESKDSDESTDSTEFSQDLTQSETNSEEGNTKE